MGRLSGDCKRGDSKRWVMRRITLSGLIFLTMTPLCAAETITWTGAAGVSSWSNAANWDLNRIPGAGDDVVIPDVDTPAVTFTSSDGTVAIHSLQIAETFRQTGGTLIVETDAALQNTHAQAGGTFRTGGSITITGNYTWTGGILGRSAAPTTLPLLTITGQLSIGSTSPALDGRTVTVMPGGLVISTSGLNLTGGTQFFVLAGAEWRFNATATVSGGDPDALVENYGLFDVNGGGGVVVSCGFSNFGRVEVRDTTTPDAVLRFGQGASMGIFDAPNRVLYISDGHAVLAGSTIRARLFAFESGDGSLYGDIDADEFVINRSQSAAPVEVETDHFNVRLLRMLQGGMELRGGPYSVEQLDMRGAASISGDADLTITGRTLAASGTFTSVGGTALLRLSGGSDPISLALLTNRRVELTGATPFRLTSLTVGANTQFLLAAGATATLEGSATTFGVASGVGTSLEIAGTLRSAVQNDVTLNGPMTVSGRVEIAPAVVSTNALFFQHGGIISGVIDGGAHPISLITTANENSWQALSTSQIIAQSLTAQGNVDLRGGLQLASEFITRTITPAAPNPVRVYSTSNLPLITINGPTAFQNALTVAAASVGNALTLSGDLTISGSCSMTGTIAAASGTTPRVLPTVGASISGQWSDTQIVAAAGTTVAITGGLDLHTAGAGIVIPAGAVLLTDGGSCTGPGFISNAGTIRRSTGNGATTLTGLRNDGTCEMLPSCGPAAEFRLENCLNRGNIVAPQHQVALRNTPSWLLDDAGSVSVARLVLASAGEMRGRVTVSGDLTVTTSASNSTVKVNPSQISAGRFVVTQGLVDCRAFGAIPLVVSGGEFHALTGLAPANVVLSNGTLSGPGPIDVAGPWTWTGGILGADAGDTFILRGPTAISMSGLGLTLRGALRIADGCVVNLTGTPDFTGARGASMIVDAGGLLRISGPARLNAASGSGAPPSLLVRGAVQITPGSSGAISMGFQTTNQGVIEAMSGTLSFTDLTNLTGTGTLGRSLTGGTFISHGNITLPNVVSITNAATIVVDGAGATIVDVGNNTGDVTIRNGAQINSANTFRNNGVLRLQSGGRVGVVWPQSGSIEMAGGILGSGAWPIQMAGGELSGYGQVGAGLTQGAGVIRPRGGVLSFVDGYRQDGGSIELQLSGPMLGTGFGQLAITPLASMHGTLDVRTSGYYLPAPGTNFVFATYSALVQQPTLTADCNGPLPFHVVYSPTAATLTWDTNLRGDANCDCRVDNFDIDPFVLRLIDEQAYGGLYPSCPPSRVDIDASGHFDNFDIDPFVSLLVNP